jgi:dephospho-CoA kinase
VKRIAVAGGIGAGKSTVVDHLRGYGFVAVDADEVYRDLTQAGQPLLSIMADAFGPSVLTTTGELDRDFMSAVIFNDSMARERVNAITHPAVGVEMRRQLDGAAGRAVFAAIPLFRPEHRTALDLDEVWMILVSPDVAMERLTQQRAMSEEEVGRRLAAQMDNQQRRALADIVIENNSSRDELLARVDELLGERGLR